MHDEDGVVDHNADQNHEAQHSDHVQLLRRHQRVGQRQLVYDGESREPAHRGGDDREHDDERIHERLKQGGHQQVGNQNRQPAATGADADQAVDAPAVPLAEQGLAGLHELVGIAGGHDENRLGDAAALTHRSDDVILQDGHGGLEGHVLVRPDRQRDRGHFLDVVDLLRRGGAYDLDNGAQ